MADDVPEPDTDPRNFYDLERAADAAARWPLLQTLWRALGGAARQAPRPQSPAQSVIANGSALETSESGEAGPRTANGAQPMPAAPPEAAPRRTEGKPAQSLEELFGRMR